MEATPGQVAAATARASRARLVAYLAGRTRDLAAAEDALSEAFRIALETWPRDGTPKNPEAWLLTVARRAHGARERRAARAEAAMPVLTLALEEAAARAGEEAEMHFPDHRVKLLFVCAHPAIDPVAHAPLMLQVVLGLDAARIAAAFLEAPATVSQRLVRAKAKIKAARVRFETPEARDLPGRLAAVLEAIYAAYGTGWDHLGGPDAKRRDLAGEALHLGRVVTRLLPDEPEAMGLLALMLYAEARAPARRDAAGRYVALAEQDTALWDADLIAEADAALARAGAVGSVGRFQCAAAIQAVHAARRVTGRTDAAALDLLYDALARFSPTVGVHVARAAARGAARGPAAGLALLDALDPARIDGYQPFWAVRARLLAEAGEPAAREAYARAAALAEDPAVRAWLAAEGARLA
jgi:RNA polymerase sigma-70 factor (ECF subfamily)